MPDVIFEPFRVKVVEPIYISTPGERERWIKEAGYNVFNLRARQVMIDLLTDSGTAAMSQEQWSAMQSGDESYAGSRSFFELERVAQEIFQKKIIIPVHQGRAGEHLVFSTLVEPGQIVPSNGHFDTTGANIEDNGAKAINLPIDEALDPSTPFPFKGNMNTSKLEALLVEQGEKIPFVMLTITNNTGGGQPVSMANIKEVKRICDAHGKDLIIDACRFAENAYFIKLREPGYENKTATEIAHESLAQGTIITFSAKKDAIANIGGLVCLDDECLAERLKNRLIITEGFATYGGLAGRDLAAIAQGLREVLDESYLRYRLRTIEWMVEQLAEAGVPVMVPAGGHAMYLDSARFFEHIPAENFPGIALIVELYLRGGIRAVELGNVAFGTRDESGKDIFPPLDLVRFAMPRRVYTEAHAGYVVQHVIDLYKNRESITGYEFEKEAPVMRHFRSRFKAVE